MVCLTAKIRFGNYAKAAMEHLEATDNLRDLVGQQQHPQNYDVTVTSTSGAVTHTAQIIVMVP